MSKPSAQQQQWIDLHPCSMCGKPLNKPFGRERAAAHYVNVQVTGSCGLTPTFRNLFIGQCCVDKLTAGRSE